MLVARACIRLSSLGLSDPERIPRLVELQRQAGAQYHGIELVARGNVAATLQELVLCIHSLACTLCICANDVLKDDDVAGLPNGIVRFGGDNQSKCLEICGCSQLAPVIAANQHFSKVHWPTLG